MPLLLDPELAALIDEVKQKMDENDLEVTSMKIGLFGRWFDLEDEDDIRKVNEIFAAYKTPS